MNPLQTYSPFFWRDLWQSFLFLFAKANSNSFASLTDRTSLTEASVKKQTSLDRLSNRFCLRKTQLLIQRLTSLDFRSPSCFNLHGQHILSGLPNFTKVSSQSCFLDVQSELLRLAWRDFGLHLLFLSLQKAVRSYTTGSVYRIVTHRVPIQAFHPRNGSITQLFEGCVPSICLSLIPAECLRWTESPLAKSQASSFYSNSSFNFRINKKAKSSTVFSFYTPGNTTPRMLSLLGSRLLIWTVLERFQFTVTDAQVTIFQVTSALFTIPQVQAHVWTVHSLPGRKLRPNTQRAHWLLVTQKQC